MVKKDKTESWAALIELSAHREKQERQSALKITFTWLGQALNACLIGSTDMPTFERLELVRTKFKGKEELRLPSRKAIRLALDTIGQAKHLHDVPDQDNCIKAVSVVREIWRTLRRSFVSSQTAQKICENIIKKDPNLRVSIFGSLARNSLTPNDIDIIVFDDGSYSSVLDASKDKGAFSVKKRGRSAIKILGLDTLQYRELVSCGWLDILLFNGKRFGLDYEYTNFIMSKQRDPYFFLNIAPEIKDYDSQSNRFMDSNINFIEKLKEINQYLRRLGFGDRLPGVLSISEAQSSLLFQIYHSDEEDNIYDWD